MDDRDSSQHGRSQAGQNGPQAPQTADASVVSIIVCIDDTDDETRSTSTGKVAGLIASAVEGLGGRIRLGTTRHQLLLRDDVPYTSHNSSMAFEAQLPSDMLDRLRSEAVEILARECVPTSDPGLAIAVVPNRDGADAEATGQIEELVAFGLRAKVEFCSKGSAYEQAGRIPWVALSEHGGDGQGVVGALAGVGLRLSGSDGRFRGKHDLARLMKGDDGLGRGRGRGAGDGTGRGRAKRDEQGNSPSHVPVGTVVEQLARRKLGPVRIVDVDGAALPADTPVLLEAETKAVYLGGSFTIVCAVTDGVAIPLAKDALSNDAGDDLYSRVCDGFEWDNDAEECSGRVESCRNCLHRRWESWGFSCMRGEEFDK